MKLVAKSNSPVLCVNKKKRNVSMYHRLKITVNLHSYAKVLPHVLDVYVVSPVECVFI